MAVDKSLVSGSTMMLILKLLEEKDMYGYEMIETLREKSENVFELKAGTLYPLLHGLEEKGFVESYEKEAVGKIRKYYHITRSGKKESGPQCRHHEWRRNACSPGRIDLAWQERKSVSPGVNNLPTFT